MTGSPFSAPIAAERGFEVDAIDFSPEMIALLERAVRDDLHAWLSVGSV